LFLVFIFILITISFFLFFDLRGILLVEPLFLLELLQYRWETLFVLDHLLEGSEHLVQRLAYEEFSPRVVVDYRLLLHQSWDTCESLVFDLEGLDCIGLRYSCDDS
jgi:hypothetical protein